jgi:hypothetical protein
MSGQAQGPAQADGERGPAQEEKATRRRRWSSSATRSRCGWCAGLAVRAAGLAPRTLSRARRCCSTWASTRWGGWSGLGHRGGVGVPDGGLGPSIQRVCVWWRRVRKAQVESRPLEPAGGRGDRPGAAAARLLRLARLRGGLVALRTIWRIDVQAWRTCRRRARTSSAQTLTYLDPCAGRGHRTGNGSAADVRQAELWKKPIRGYCHPGRPSR